MNAILIGEISEMFRFVSHEGTVRDRPLFVGGLLEIKKYTPQPLCCKLCDERAGTFQVSAQILKTCVFWECDS